MAGHEVVLAVGQGRAGVETGLLRLHQTVNDRREAVNCLGRVLGLFTLALPTRGASTVNLSTLPTLPL